MKRIFFDKNGKVKSPFFPFWQPWGCMGCLWRVIVFFLGLVLLLFLLASLFRGREGGKDDDDKIIYIPKEPIPSELTDSAKVVEWADSIPGVKELPLPGDNYIPPIKPRDVVINPEDSLGKIVKNQIIVFFNSNDMKNDMTSFAQQFKIAYPDAGYTIIYYNPTAGTMLLQVPEERVIPMLSEIPECILGIDYKLTTNEILSYGEIPSDPGFRKQKYAAYFNDIQAFPAWDITTGNTDVKVAIVDSYFSLEHPELNSRWVDPIHIPSKTRNVLPRAGAEMGAACHGSHVASIAIGNMNNDSGTCGIAPNCQWIPISLGEELSLFHIMEGILYAVYRDADVVNVSIGKVFPEGVDRMLTLEEQVQLAQASYERVEDIWRYVYKVATDRRCVIVTAAGNENILMALDPGKRNEFVVKVEAANGPDRRASFSNYGLIPSVNVNYSTVTAPGVGILGSVVNGKYMEYDGTSMAAPFVTGAVALMKSIDKTLTAEEVIKILQWTGKPLDEENMVGPLIQIHDALQSVKEGLLNFDEVIKDNGKLLGKWEATTTLSLISGETEEKIDDMYTTMEFTSLSTGVIEHQTYSTKLVYRAPLVVSFGENTINITQTGDAVCITDQNEKINRDDYICKPDKNRLMEVSVMREGNLRFKFNMRKIK